MSAPYVHKDAEASDRSVQKFEISVRFFESTVVTLLQHDPQLTCNQTVASIGHVLPGLVPPLRYGEATNNATAYRMEN